jgi:NADH-quinone oxidoreductase subunit J
MVLFLFVIMLVNVGAEERGGEMLFNRPAQVATSTVLLVLLSLGFIYAIRQGYEGLLLRDNLSTQEQRVQSANRRSARQENLRPAATGTSRLSEDTQLVGASLYRFAALPFEIASVLLLVAIIGSVMLARTSKQEAATDDLETAAED